MTWKWSRQPRAAAAWTLFAVLVAAGCGDDTTTGGGGAGGTGAAGGGPQGGQGGQGGDGGEPQGGMPPGGGGGEGGGGGGPPVCDIDQFADVAEGRMPLDATPSPDGCTIYFTGITAALEGGVYVVSAEGGNVAFLTEGGPLRSPFGIATSTDGDTLYIADSAADEDGSDRGAIFSLASGGGTPSPVSGTTGLSPRSLEVREEGNSDQIYFTGRTAGGLPAVYKVSAAGGSADELTTGVRSSDFSGIALASNGDAYFVDTTGELDGSARVMVLVSGEDVASVVLGNLRVGYPAGLAITIDDQTLWLSGLDPATLTDVLFQIDVNSLDVVDFTGDPNTLTGFREPAGIHRAKNVDIFAFADSRAGAGGTVFSIQP